MNINNKPNKIYKQTMYTPPINEPCDTTKCKECVLLYVCKTKVDKTRNINLI